VRGSDLATVARDALARVADARLRALPFSLRFWDGSTLPAATGGPDLPIVVVRSPTALAYLAREPNELGLSRAWVTGALEVDGDLEAVLAARDRYSGLAISAAERLRLASAALLAAGPALLRRPPPPAIEARQRGRRHSLARDRNAVRHHYDVPGAFYRIVLGPSMTYSCAYFGSAEEELEVAQERKHELICRKLRLAPGERLLDIGCGWGSLLLHAADRHGVRGVGVTLSQQQADLARARVREARLSDLVEIRTADYREMRDGPFDKIVSVGMYEHVGRSELGRYANTVSMQLRPGGLFLNHGIARLGPAPPEPDAFIARYIFPDGELHPIAELATSMQSAGLEIRDVESLREHYPLTLRRWVANLEANRAEAIAVAGAQRERAWRLYMLGSAQAFEAGQITVYQVLAARTGAAHRLPLDRAELIAPVTAGA
jgi:cyclopropane-fatty-acyl-phospholipid synthase